MRSLIVPAASSSYNIGRSPHWMLTHPNGKLMITESIAGLDLDWFDAIYIVLLEEYKDIENSLRVEFESITSLKRLHFVFITETTSQPQTIYECIKKENITGFIFIKDSDNFFRYETFEENNFVCYADLNNHSDVSVKNKSFITFDKYKILDNIVEKYIISSTFSVGGYGFQSSEEFCHYYENCPPHGQLYVSNIIFGMMLSSNAIFKSEEVDDYLDWGTKEDWNKFKKEFITLFLDLDGVLVYNTSPIIPPTNGDGRPLTENIQTIRDLYKTGKCFVVITTSRPHRLQKLTRDELNKHQIPYDSLVMNLPHCQRIVINDYAPSNQYPSCSAINLSRNSDTLREYLK